VSDFAATATSIAFILGEVRAFAMAAPVKWLACDGAAISRTTYAALFAAVGTAWGVGDGSTTFNLPDLRGRTPIGAGTGSSLTARTLAATGGAETHTLTTAEMPSHTHNNNIAGGTSGTAPRFSYVANDGNAITQTLSTGGGGAHNNMQPFAVVNYAIYTGV
jgi:microcystin-dependent protein